MTTYPGQISQYLTRLYSAEARRFAFRGETAAEFDAWAAEARPVLRALIGLDAIRRATADFTPSVDLGAPEDAGDHYRQAGVLHAESQFDVPFWYLTPTSPGPHPLALFPHGHYRDRGLDWAAGIAGDEATRARIAAEDRDVAVQAGRRGVAAIAPSTRGFLPAAVPDLTERHGGSNCRAHFIHALLAGRTAIGERVWDLERLIDWAATRTEIDPSRVLMMGNSGGGVATLYAAACDTRVTTAVASCSYCSYVGREGFVHHCDCNCVPGMLAHFEFHDVAGLIAPRRLLVVHGRQDSLFPWEEVEGAVAAARRIFTVAVASEQFRHEVGEGGHRFYSALMWPFVVSGQ